MPIDSACLCMVLEKRLQNHQKSCKNRRSDLYRGCSDLPWHRIRSSELFVFSRYFQIKSKFARLSAALVWFPYWEWVVWKNHEKFFWLKCVLNLASIVLQHKLQEFLHNLQRFLRSTTLILSFLNYFTISGFRIKFSSQLGYSQCLPSHLLCTQRHW